MYLVLQALADANGRARPVVRLAAGTLLRLMDEVDTARAFRDLDDFVIYVRMVRFEQVGSGVPMESPLEPGRVGHRKSERLLTIDVYYNEISMVRPDGREVAVSRDYLDTFADRIETAVARLVAWCDRKKAWAHRDHYMECWGTALRALKKGSLLRPYEFTTTAKIREALDACWSLVEAEALESERFEALAEAYYLLRDAGWEEAEYEEDPTREATPYGQPCKVANFGANLATSPAPDATFTYSMA